MSGRTVSIPAYRPHHENPFGPTTIEHRSADAGLTRLGTYFMHVTSSGFSDPWTLRYEETIYVIAGRAALKVHGEHGVTDVTAEQDELLVLPEGVTVQYGGDPGSRLLLSISPVNWRDS